jgi:hypothetical protein
VEVIGLVVLTGSAIVDNEELSLLPQAGTDAVLVIEAFRECQMASGTGYDVVFG